MNPMKRPLIALASLLLLAANASSQSAEPRPVHLLLTSFDPFGGSSKNNTQEIVALVKAQAVALGANVTVETCNLPVVYDQAAEVAMKCVDQSASESESQSQPDAVISFGEADCTLQIESAATNLDNTPSLADNAGNLRAGSAIVAGAPARSSFAFPVQAMYCALGAHPEHLNVSIDPGAFVCNNTAYLLSRELKARSIPFTFIHVPNSRCAAGGEPELNAARIEKMLAGAIADLRAPLVNHSIWPHPGNGNVLPTDAASAQALVTALQARGAPACEQSYAEALASDYAQAP